MIPVFPEGEYDRTSAWQNASDRASWERIWQTGTEGQKKMAQAVVCVTAPAGVIRANMTAPVVRQAGSKTSLTISDVLEVGPQGFNPGHLYDRAPTDFSGTPAGY